MRNSLILAGLAAALLSGTALAADLPRRAEPPVFTPIPVFAWTGAYLGINAGYAYTEGDTLRTTGIGALQANVVNDLRRPAVGLPQDGFSAGGQGGYNFQLTPGTGFVIGVEADAQYMDLQRSRAETIFRPAFNPNVLTNVYRADLDFLGTVRGRIGYTFDRVLVYGTGGFAYGGGSNPANASTYTGTLPGTFRTGWTAGGGVEYAFTERLRARIEALYVSLDRNGGSGGLVYDTATAAYYGLGKPKAEFGVVRAGLNYRFSTD